MFQDLRYGLRMLAKSKGFAAAAVLSLALGIGANTSIFTLFYSVAWRPLPVKDPDRIVKVYQTFEGEISRQVSGNIELLSYPEYVDYRDRTHVFAGLTAYRDGAFSLGGSEGEKVEGLLVTDNSFSVLGAEAVLGGAAGLLLAYWLPPILLSAFAAEGLGADVTPNLTVFGYCFLLSQMAGVVFGLAPALEATRLDLTSALKDEGGFGQRLDRSRLRSLLVITQVTVAFVLLIGAGLLVRSLQRAHSADLGFDPKNVLVLNLDLASERYDAPKASQFYRQLSERLTALPGVKSMSLAGMVPFSGSNSTGITVEGDSGGEAREVNFNAVSPQYFRTLGIPIVRGRAFNEDEARTGQALAVVSEAMAQRFWPAGDPIGKRFKDGSSSYEIIGVARDISSIRLAEPDGPLFYRPASGKQTGFAFLLRTDANPGAVIAAVRSEVRSLDKNLPISVYLMANREFRHERFGAMFSSVLGLLALALAMVGIYGVTNYAVSQRTREIGIRLALGAQTGDALRLVVRQGLRLIAIGIGIGLLFSVAVGFVLTRALYGLSALDPMTFAGVSLLVGAVALLACYFPARKATKVDPIVALRHE